MTSSRTNEYRTWDVVLVPFPYSEQARHRVRPAVVVSSPTFSRQTGMYYVAMITNAAHETWHGDVPVSDLKVAGLPIASVVRPAKISTIDEQALIRRLGSLPRKDRMQVARSLRDFLVHRTEAP